MISAKSWMECDVSPSHRCVWSQPRPEILVKELTIVSIASATPSTFDKIFRMDPATCRRTTSAVCSLFEPRLRVSKPSFCAKELTGTLELVYRAA